MEVGRRAFEGRDDAAAVLFGAVALCQAGGKQSVGAGADLLGGAVVDLEAAGAAGDVDAERLPGEGGAEDALADVAGEEEAVGAADSEGREETEFGGRDVLGLVDQYVIPRARARRRSGRRGGGTTWRE